MYVNTAMSFFATYQRPTRLILIVRKIELYMFVRTDGEIVFLIILNVLVYCFYKFYIFKFCSYILLYLFFMNSALKEYTFFLLIYNLHHLRVLRNVTRLAREPMFHHFIHYLSFVVDFKARTIVEY